MATWLVVGATCWVSSVSLAQESAPAEKPETPKFEAGWTGPLSFRNIGPALMAGRIADIAVDSEHPNTWYIGVGSGGVWKTTNSGTTWTPIFDGQSVY
ncbi:MAG: hypothetical protein ACK5Z0_05595, partial [Planctomycetota bacterium]